MVDIQGPFRSVSASGARAGRNDGNGPADVRTTQRLRRGRPSQTSMTGPKVPRGLATRDTDPTKPMLAEQRLPPQSRTCGSLEDGITRPRVRSSVIGARPAAGVRAAGTRRRRRWLSLRSSSRCGCANEHRFGGGRGGEGVGRRARSAPRPRNARGVRATTSPGPRARPACPVSVLMRSFPREQQYRRLRRAARVWQQTSPLAPSPWSRLPSERSRQPPGCCSLPRFSRSVHATGRDSLVAAVWARTRRGRCGVRLRRCGRRGGGCGTRSRVTGAGISTASRSRRPASRLRLRQSARRYQPEHLARTPEMAAWLGTRQRPGGTQIPASRAQLERTACGDIDARQEQSPGKRDPERDRHGRGERRL